MGFDPRDLNWSVEGFSWAIKNRSLTVETTEELIKNLYGGVKCLKKCPGLSRYYRNVVYVDNDINGYRFKQFVNFCKDYFKCDRFAVNFATFFNCIYDLYEDDLAIVFHFLMDNVLTKTCGYRKADLLLQKFNLFISEQSQ